MPGDDRSVVRGWRNLAEGSGPTRTTHSPTRNPVRVGVAERRNIVHDALARSRDDIPGLVVVSAWDIVHPVDEDGEGKQGQPYNHEDDCEDNR